jgi:uncharacterized repeat protein (TIGR03803 family)
LDVFPTRSGEKRDLFLTLVSLCHALCSTSFIELRGKEVTPVHGKQQVQNSVFSVNWRSANPPRAILLRLLFLVFLFVMLTAQPGQTQTFRAIYNFRNGADGAYPAAGLTMDAAGNLYGTTWENGGGSSYGTVFELKRSRTGWIFMPLYQFAGGYDGAYPYGRVSLAADGSLYGTTTEGGTGNCGGYTCGTVFHLSPPKAVPPSALAPWAETVIQRFTGQDGGYPTGDLMFDAAGNVYGTAACCGGGVYELTPSQTGWTETVLYSNGAGPTGGVISDQAGNLYYISAAGGQYGQGAVYQLFRAGSGWSQQVLHSFNGSDGEDPQGGLIIDSLGNLYGSTALGGYSDSGTAFELTPAGGSWNFTSLYQFSGSPGRDEWGPEEKLAMDSTGNLYGTTRNDGPYLDGSVFKLTYVGGNWEYTSLHAFNGSDGNEPVSGVVFDADGNLYGTTLAGGAYGFGIVWEITP